MISKCSTVVLSKSKFSEFEPLPDDTSLDNVFLAGYTSAEDGTTYNVKVQASKLTESKTPNIIYELGRKDCCDNKYKWVEIEKQFPVGVKFNACEFNTVDYGNYIEVKTLASYIPEMCPDNVLYIKQPEGNIPGTEFTIFIRDLDPIDFNKICLCDSCGNIETVYAIEEGKTNRWSCLFKLIVSSDKVHSFCAIRR